MVVGIVYIRGNVLFDAEIENLLKLTLVPWYLICCGLIIGYLIATLWAGRPTYQDFDNKEKIAIKSFIIGIVLWLVFAFVYIFV